MSNPWDDSMHLAVLRLDWARRHIEDFGGKVNGFLDYNPYAAVPEVQDEREGPDRDIIRVKYIFRSTGEPPASLRFIAGDIIHNLRSVVDNLVWGVAMRCSASKRLSLVFKNSPAHFDEFALDTKFHRLPIPIQCWFKNEQAYNRPNKATSLLGALTEFWNGDKHRAPALIAKSVPGGGISQTCEEFVMHFLGNVHEGAVLAEALLKPEQVEDFKPIFTFDVGISEGSSSRSSAYGFFIEVERHIREEVFPKFEPFLI